MISDELTKLYEGTNERVGFILATGETVECKNVSLTPDVAFEVSGEDLMLYADDAVSSADQRRDWRNLRGIRLSLKRDCVAVVAKTAD